MGPWKLKWNHLLVCNFIHTDNWPCTSKYRLHCQIVSVGNQNNTEVMHDENRNFNLINTVHKNPYVWLWLSLRVIQFLVLIFAQTTFCLCMHLKNNYQYWNKANSRLPGDKSHAEDACKRYLMWKNILYEYRCC